MGRILVELRSAEGGDDSKLLVMDMVGVYGRACRRRCL
jgi:protein subunit release factor A